MEIFFPLLATRIAFTKVAQVNARQNDFPHALCYNLVGFGDDIFYTVATAVAARQGYGAKRTIVIAAILYFQESAGTLGMRVRRMKTIHFFDIAGADPGAVAFGQVL